MNLRFKVGLHNNNFKGSGAEAVEESELEQDGKDEVAQNFASSDSTAEVFCVGLMKAREGKVIKVKPSYVQGRTSRGDGGYASPQYF